MKVKLILLDAGSMYQLRSDFKYRKRLGDKIKIPLISGMVFLFISCQNDIETIKAFNVGKEQPSVTYENVDFEYTDTAKMQAKLSTPIVHYFVNVEKPYYEFPLGIQVLFYNEKEEVKSMITSKYALFKKDEELFEVRDSVVSVNLEDGQKVETEQLFWSRKEKIIYSNVFTKISGEDGVHFGEKGFEATQDLSSYKLIGSSGNMRVKDEENP